MFLRRRGRKVNWSKPLLIKISVFNMIQANNIPLKAPRATLTLHNLTSVGCHCSKMSFKYSFFFFISSQPIGNATVDRWLPLICPNIHTSSLTQLTLFPADRCIIACWQLSLFFLFLAVRFTACVLLYSLSIGLTLWCYLHFHGFCYLLVVLSYKYIGIQRFSWTLSHVTSPTEGTFFDIK